MLATAKTVEYAECAAGTWVCLLPTAARPQWSGADPCSDPAAAGRGQAWLLRRVRGAWAGPLPSVRSVAVWVVPDGAAAPQRDVARTGSGRIRRSGKVRSVKDADRRAKL